MSEYQAFRPVTEKWLSWLESAAGKQLIDAEQSALDRLMPGLFGYHLLTMSPTGRLALSRESTIKHRFSAELIQPLAGQDQSFVMSADALPFAEGALDVIVLHHVLDFGKQPHQILRECIRTLLPSGHIVIVTYHPANWQQGKRWPFMSSRRLHDWLALLSCRVEHTESHFVTPASATGWGNLKQSLAEWLGVFTVTVACKEVSSMTPLKPSWKMRPLLPVSVARPSMRVPASSEKRKLKTQQNQHKDPS
ncbi:class I SAM-dependent methyltransferase [Pokkaliibacter sp. CJK22405]|uniref:class I SAM-dependent methyltransferase n=1 Tax=Pokkaliibacter sp. CJK22405 TaxID=3384615 RepID=UPI003984EAC0